MRRITAVLCGGLLTGYLVCAANPVRADTLTASLWGVDNSTSEYSGFTTVNLTLLNPDNSQYYSGSVITGMQRYNQTAGPGQVAQGTTFNTVCIEITQDVYLTNPNTPYTFTLQDLASSPEPNNPIVQTVPGGGASGMGTLKAQLISELWAADYNNALTTFDLNAAFQLAVWKIVYGDVVSEATPPGTGSGFIADSADGSNDYLDLSLSDGQLTALATGGEQSMIVNGAQAYLDALNLSSSNYANLVALTSGANQDQITVAVPLPTTASTGLVLLGGLGVLGGVGAIRRRRQMA